MDAFHDPRYTKMDGKPIVVIFHPLELPQPKRFTELWKELAVKAGLKGLYFVGIDNHSWDPEKHGFDACALDYFSTVRRELD